MRVEDATGLRTLPLFADVSEESFVALIRAAFLQRFPAGVILIHEGEPADFLHVVVEGRIELFATHEGRESTILIIRPVSTFVSAAVIRDEVYLKGARTLERSRILMLPANSVREIFGRDWAFARSLVHDLAASYQTVVKELKNQKLRPAVERLANWLLRLHAEQGESGTVQIAFEKKVLASRLGMTPENLSRAFATLGPYGVEVNGRSIRLTKREDLKRLAKPNPLIDE